MRRLLVPVLTLAMTVIGLAAFAGPAMAADNCGYTISGRWGFLDAKAGEFRDQGSATAQSCNGIKMSLEGLKGGDFRPESIMSAQGAASFASNLNFIARSFVPEDDRIATKAGQMPWQIFPMPKDVTASETQLALRSSDGLADTLFFRITTGDLCFIIVRAVKGASYDDLLAGGDLLNPNL